MQMRISIASSVRFHAELIKTFATIVILCNNSPGKTIVTSRFQ